MHLGSKKAELSLNVGLSPYNGGHAGLNASNGLLSFLLGKVEKGYSMG